MKQNHYDNKTFFAKYKEFPRSKYGLEHAGEWHELKKLLPDFTGKDVLDVGCGFGWHCVYAAEQGARNVVGIDVSERMLALAKEKTSLPNVTYQKMAMEDMRFPSLSFHIVISSLAFHYTSNFATVCQNIFDFLMEDGDFVFSVEHPIFTAYGSQDWIYDKNEKRMYWPVDTYFDEGERYTTFLDETILKYHKTLQTYLMTLLDIGFSIQKVIEPKPSAQLLKTVPEMQDELRRPMMLLIAAKK